MHLLIKHLNHKCKMKKEITMYSEEKINKIKPKICMKELCNHYIAYCRNVTVPMDVNENCFNIVEQKIK